MTVKTVNLLTNSFIQGRGKSKSRSLKQKHNWQVQWAAMGQCGWIRMNEQTEMRGGKYGKLEGLKRQKPCGLTGHFKYFRFSYV